MTHSKDSSPDFTDMFDKLATFYSTERNKGVTKKEIFQAIFLLISDSANLELAGHLWYLKLSDEEAKELLKDFDFETLKTTIEIDTNIFPLDVLFQKRVLIKDRGLVWIIHKNDKDPFPSNPHAHCYDQNLKLDLSNGNYYRNRVIQGKVNKRELLSIRDKVSKVFHGELPLLKIDNSVNPNQKK